LPYGFYYVLLLVDEVILLDSEGSNVECDDDPNEEPVLLRRSKVYTKRKDRAVNSLESALDPGNYIPIAPPEGTEWRLVKLFSFST
jgi:hypothetical protein